MVFVYLLLWHGIFWRVYRIPSIILTWAPSKIQAGKWVSFLRRLPWRGRKKQSRSFAKMIRFFNPFFQNPKAKVWAQVKPRSSILNTFIQEMALSVNQKHITTAPVGSQAKEIAVSVPHSSDKMADDPEPEQGKESCTVATVAYRVYC